jgi:flagellar motor switch protein FliG
MRRACCANGSARDEARTLTGLRKSAIVLLSLGEEQAAEVLRLLDPEASARVRREMQAALASSPDDRADAMAAFVASASVAPDDAPPSSSTPFAAFHDTETQALLDSLREEHPQTIALVLAHLRPAKAGEILAALSSEQQIEVVKRIAGIEQTSTHVIEQVEDGLRQRLGRIIDGTIRAGGVSAVAEILNSADRRTEREILHTLESDSPELAEQIRRTQAVFEDLLHAADEDMRAVLAQLDDETIALALRPASERLVRKVLRNLSQEEAQHIEHDLKSLDAVRVTDIESAQQRVAEIVQRLNATGEISIHGKRPRRPRRGHESSGKVQ